MKTVLADSTEMYCKKSIPFGTHSMQLIHYLPYHVGLFMYHIDLTFAFCCQNNPFNFPSLSNYDYALFTVQLQCTPDRQSHGMLRTETDH